MLERFTKKEGRNFLCGDLLRFISKLNEMLSYASGHMPDQTLDKGYNCYNPVILYKFKVLLSLGFSIFKGSSAHKTPLLMNQ